MKVNTVGLHYAYWNSSNGQTRHSLLFVVNECPVLSRLCSDLIEPYMWGVWVLMTTTVLCITCCTVCLAQICDRIFPFGSQEQHMIFFRNSQFSNQKIQDMVGIQSTWLSDEPGKVYLREVVNVLIDHPQMPFT